jgi:hypothetical protein
MRFVNILFLTLLLWACKAPKLTENKAFGEPNPLIELIEKNPVFREIVEKKHIYEPQIVFTQINRDEKNRPSMRVWTWNCDEKRYFYPASTIKLPVALLALEWLNEQKNSDLTRKTPIFHQKSRAPQSEVTADTSNFLEKNTPTIENYIKKILLVSDNDAYNRLFELLGQEYINKKLQQKGMRARILHRLQVSGFSPEENCQLNPIYFEKNGRKIFERPAIRSAWEPDFLPENEQKGIGFYRNDSLISRPFDFSKKNFIRLIDLNQTISRVVFMKYYEKNQQFLLTENDRKFVLKYMSMFPAESKSPRFSEPDGYCKFVLWGGEGAHADENLRIFNKVGDAYGYLLDAAYVVDFATKTEFFVTAVIHCNPDGIFNDDQYEYDSVGFPFFKNLGKTLLEFERKRPKKFKPDLSEFQFSDYRD